MGLARGLGVCGPRSGGGGGCVWTWSGSPRVAESMRKDGS